MRYRCWEDMRESGERADEFVADDPEEAAEMYVEKIEDFGDLGSSVDVNVSQQLGSGIAYWTVLVHIDWEPSFHADKAKERDGAP